MVRIVLLLSMCRYSMHENLKITERKILVLTRNHQNRQITTNKIASYCTRWVKKTREKKSSMRVVFIFLFQFLFDPLTLCHVESFHHSNYSTVDNDEISRFSCPIVSICLWISMNQRRPLITRKHPSIEDKTNESSHVRISYWNFSKFRESKIQNDSNNHPISPRDQERTYSNIRTNSNRCQSVRLFCWLIDYFRVNLVWSNHLMIKAFGSINQSLNIQQLNRSHSQPYRSFLFNESRRVGGFIIRFSNVSVWKGKIVRLFLIFTVTKNTIQVFL